MHFPIPSTIFEHGRAWTAPHFVVWSPLVSRVGSGRAGGALAPGCLLRAGMEFMCAIFGCRKPKADVQGLDGFEPVPKAGTHATAPNVDKGLLDLDDAAKAGAMPRWVVTTRPWAQTEAEKTIDDYESAQIVFDQAGSNGS